MGGLRSTILLLVVLVGLAGYIYFVDANRDPAAADVKPKAFVELSADSIEEIKTTCACCNRKAVFNLKSVDGKPTLSGPSRTLGCEELYLPVCHTHYLEKLELSADQLHDLLAEPEETI